MKQSREVKRTKTKNIINLLNTKKPLTYILNLNKKTALKNK